MRLLVLLSLLSIVINADGGILKVDWSKIDSSIQKPRVIPTKLQNGIRDVRLPVYIPNQYLQNGNISIVSDKNFYSITIPLKGATLMISGDRTYQDSFSDLRLKSSSPNGIIHSNGMASLDFFKHGVSYSLVIECKMGADDPRCGEDTFLKDIYKRLIFIGGRR